jgi:glycosyltransferase involved in cell wall biosynthesis
MADEDAEGTWMTDGALTRLDGPGSGGTETADQLRVLHVVVQAGPTNSQWNEHCLPVADERRLVVCSLFPATVPEDRRIERFEGDGTKRGALAVLRQTLRRGGYDLVHVHAPASAALLIAACALEHRTRSDIVFTLHTSWRIARPRNRWLAAAAIRAFPYPVCVSRSAAESVPTWVRRLAGQPLAVVPNGVDVDRIDRARSGPFVDQSRDPESGLTFVTVGRLIPIKNHATVLRAFAKFAGWDDRLLVIGDGPIREELEQLNRSLGIEDRVKMLGLVPRDEVYRLLAAADAFVSSSHGEGLPVGVLEAMAAELPVVLSDIAPHREIVESTPGATLVAPDDVTALADAMSRLRDTDLSARRAAGRSARRTVVDRFGLRSMAAGYDDVYAGVAAAGALLKENS